MSGGSSRRQAAAPCNTAMLLQYANYLRSALVERRGLSPGQQELPWPAGLLQRAVSEAHACGPLHGCCAAMCDALGGRRGLPSGCNLRSHVGASAVGRPGGLAVCVTRAAPESLAVAGQQMR